MTGAPAVLRFSRDRRGYEHFYLVQPASHRRGTAPARILYWFRTPPGIKVGRPPFDDEMRRRIAAQNPGVKFDWPQLLATPIPPPSGEVERWRERRRAEKAEKAARAARRADLATGGEDEIESDADQPDAQEEPSFSRGIPGTDDEVAGATQGEAPAPVVPVAAAFAPPADASRPDTPPDSPTRKRRRRRRRRGRSRPDAVAADRAGVGVDSDPVPSGSESTPTPPRFETSNE